MSYFYTEDDIWGWLKQGTSKTKGRSGRLKLAIFEPYSSLFCLLNSAVKKGPYLGSSWIKISGKRAILRNHLPERITRRKYRLIEARPPLRRCILPLRTLKWLIRHLFGCFYKRSLVSIIIIIETLDYLLTCKVILLYCKQS